MQGPPVDQKHMVSNLIIRILTLLMWLRVSLFTSIKVVDLSHVNISYSCSAALQSHCKAIYFGSPICFEICKLSTLHFK